MRGISALVLFVVLVLATTASAGLAKPTIVAVDRSPVVVHGTGFGPRERVLVTVRTGAQRAARRTTATYRGSFVVRFEGLRLACTATLVATGGRGHVAQLKLSLRECPGPALDP